MTGNAATSRWVHELVYDRLLALRRVGHPEYSAEHDCRGSSPLEDHGVGGGRVGSVPGTVVS